MNCYFNILWFEDEVAWFTPNERKLRELLLESHNLLLKVKRLRSGDFDDSLLAGNNYDLILMDYKLATDETGEKIIKRIRSHDVLTDILFYSSQYNVMLESIKEAILESIVNETPLIDGVYYASRKETAFYERLESLINKIVRRSEDMVNLRGFVLDNACDFEVRTCLILEMCWHQFTDLQRETLDSFTRELIHKLSAKRQDESEKLLKKDSTCLYPAAVKPNAFLAHTDKLRLLEHIIQILNVEYGFNITDKLVNFRANYEHDFSNYRNALGHRKDEDDSIPIRGEDVKVDSNLHRQLRATIHEYDGLISALETYIRHAKGEDR